MSRDDPPAPDPESGRESDPSGPTDPSGPPEPTGRLGLIGPGPLVSVGLVGLLVGWSVRSVWLRLDRPVPEVPWGAVAVVWFFAVLIGAVAYLTWRTLHRDGRRLSVDQSVNRLVLGKASAVLGAALVGGYLGFGIAHVGIASPVAAAQILRSGVAVVGAILLLVAGLGLERACRVRDVDE